MRASPGGHTTPPPPSNESSYLASWKVKRRASRRKMAQVALRAQPNLQRRNVTSASWAEIRWRQGMAQVHLRQEIRGRPSEFNQVRRIAKPDVVRLPSAVNSSARAPEKVSCQGSELYFDGEEFWDADTEAAMQRLMVSLMKNSPVSCGFQRKQS